MSDLETRRQVKDLFDRERLAASQFFDDSRRSKYLSLKLEGIMEAPGQSLRHVRSDEG